MKGGDNPWDRRIRRATDLAVKYPFAAEGLSFYGHVASFQRSLYEGLGSALAPSRGVGPRGSRRDDPQLSVLLPWFAPFLSFIADTSPPPLARPAAGLDAGGETRGRGVL